MSPPSSIASGLILSAVNLASKAFLNVTTQAYEVRGLPHLLDALGASSNKDAKPINGEVPFRRGVLTGMLEIDNQG